MWKRTDIHCERLEDRTVPTLLVEQVANINRIGTGEIRGFHDVDGTLVFSANDGTHGNEIWTSSPAGVELLRDIRPGMDPSQTSIADGAVANGVLYFTANDGVTGSETWRSDGTSSGTYLLRDLVPGGVAPNPKGSGGYDYTEVNGTVYFAGITSTSAKALYRSDGTSSGTTLVVSFDNAFRLGSLVNLNGVLYFAAGLNTNNFEIWKSDGTSTGTIQVSDIIAGPNGTEIQALTPHNGALYFIAADEMHGPELWRSDGTSAGTALLAEIFPGTTNDFFDSNPIFLSTPGGLYFTANTAGMELWKTDGTSAGTMLVRDIYPDGSSSSPKNLARFGDKILFTATSAAGIEVWISDGTAAGTVILSDITPGPGSSFSATSTPEFAVLNGLAYFGANSPGVGFELWRTDGTSSGTALFKDIRTGTGSATPNALIAINDRLAFIATDGVLSQEVWFTDGTVAGTAVSGEIDRGTSGSMRDRLLGQGQTDFGLLDGKVYFSASNGSGFELWQTHDTTATFFRDLGNPPDSLDFGPGGFVRLGTRLLFGAKSLSTGLVSSRMHVTDGTSAGTSFLLNSTGKELLTPNYLVPVGTQAFFTATARGDSFGQELYITDGTSSGTRLVRDILPGTASSGVARLFAAHGSVYFQANDGTNGLELWKSDGTSGGTVRVADLNSGPGSISPFPVAAIGNTLYFLANVSSYGNELWRTDGTSIGTQIVRDIRVGPDSSQVSSNVPEYEVVDNILFFIANDGFGREEVWRTDGTSSGTMLVRDINPVTYQGTISNLTNVNGILYFSAFDQQYRTELWRSDGTSAGTMIVRDLAPQNSSNPSNLINFQGTLIFSAETELGREIWQSDGTSAGTTILRDLAPGPNSSEPDSFRLVGNDLYFSANDPATGRELWRLTSLSRLRTMTAPSGAYATGETVEIKLNFSEPMTLENGTMSIMLNSGTTLTVAPFADAMSVTANYTIAPGDTASDLAVLEITLTGGARLKDQSGFDDSIEVPGDANLNLTSNVIVNPLPPTTVSAIGINLGDVQRSQVTAIQLNFATPVDAAQLAQPSAISLARTTGSPFSLQTGIIVAPATGMVTSITLTFENVNGIENGSLSDGRWRVDIPYLSYVSPEFHRLFGDVNGDGTVDGPNDFAAFGNAFGTTVANSPFDFNADGTIDGPVDFAQFGGRFGITV